MHLRHGIFGSLDLRILGQAVCSTLRVMLLKIHRHRRVEIELSVERKSEQVVQLVVKSTTEGPL